MMNRVGDEELTGGGGVAFEIKEDSIDIGFGMGILTFGDGVGERGIPIDKVEGVVGQFAEVVPNGFVGTVNGSIERGVVDIDPIGFFISGLNDCVLRELKIER